MDERPLDATELLESIKAEHRATPWVPLAPSDELSKWREWPMRSEASLHYLHQHWVLPDSAGPEAAGKGMKGKVIRLFARLTFRVLANYLQEERELIAHMVRTSDALAKRCDALAQEITRREIAESENAAQLATWLNDDVASSAVALGKINRVDNRLKPANAPPADPSPRPMPQ